MAQAGDCLRVQEQVAAAGEVEAENCPHAGGGGTLGGAGTLVASGSMHLLSRHGSLLLLSLLLNQMRRRPSWFNGPC